ncbi:MAG: hypothetical protein HYV03_00925 [Deltaproteobacteria bacterium]|nr:hypothetical protein [Deltaproteobacteria bacterium]
MDIPHLLKLFNAHRVKYVVIGATAFPPHGFSRVTLDLDIFIEPTVINAERARDALRIFGYDVTDLTIESMLAKKTLFRGYGLESDIHPFVTGVDAFEAVWRARMYGNIEGVPTNFASLDDLITMKRAAGRGKDLDDLRYLEKIRAIKRKRKQRK